jgi:2,4-dienoyl-CoA reductase-like NADH-dependent reductase (Old Yellow Enzyme family)
MQAAKLFETASFRSVTARNRIVVSPMCQYSAVDGLGSDWHVQHLGAKAVGGAGIVFVEATHVAPVARITPGCLGLWDDAQQALVARLAAVITLGGSVPGIQIAHAGRKASCHLPWQGGKPIAPEYGGWTPLGPTDTPFHPDAPRPHALSVAELGEIVGQFAATTRRAREAGFKIVEIHSAHGYLLHSFLSPLSNTRDDGYGGDLAGRARLLLEVVAAVRSEWPDELPLFVRLSCVDWMAGGLTIDDSVQIAGMLKATGQVDLIDCSSGGVDPAQQIASLHPAYQVPFAEAIRHRVGIPTGAVGLITTAELAEAVLGNGRADLIFLARAILADPAWPLRAARLLGATPPLAQPYHRAHLP